MWNQILRNLNFFRYNYKMNSAKVSTNENLDTLTLLLKSGLSRFTSPVKIVFAWNIVLSSQCQIFIKKLSEIEVTKKDVMKFLTFHMNFKIFFQNYSLSIINAHCTSITCKRVLEYGARARWIFRVIPSAGERRVGRGWWGVVTASHL